VLLHDRATDRQSHPQPLRLGGVKRREDLVELLRGQPHPTVLDRHEHRARRLLTCPDPHLARALGHGGQRLQHVQHEVEQDLLELHPITHHRGEVGGDLHVQGYPLVDEFMLEQADDLVHERRQRQPRRRGSGFAQERAQPGNDLAGPLPVVDDALERLAGILKVGRRPRQPAQASTAVGHDGREGLVDFVGDRGGQFAQGGHARDVRQLRLRLAQGFLGPLAFGDVLDHADREHHCAALVSHNVYGHVAPDESAVLADIAFLYVVVVASATQHIGKGCPVGLYIVGVREGREGHALELLGTAMTARA
jgi:hypothetical protein